MNVEINHRQANVPDKITSLGALMRKEGFGEKGIAVAVNGRVVPKAEWERHSLVENMKITVIRAVCGG